MPLLASGDVPPLLVSFAKGPSDYTIQLTDLANVWAESLDRKSICIRAWNQDTSIDPSDTTENMTTFLKSLHSAVDASVPGHDDTSVQLARASASDAGEDGLILKIECQLPGFPDLKWPFHLKRAESNAIAGQLVIPLVQAQLARQREAASLMQLLKHKDSVISKLCDKLEATGTGLDQVFTALAARKSISRQAAEDKVKGLSPFKEATWKSALRHEFHGAQSLPDLTTSVFGGDALLLPDSTMTDDAAVNGSWWQSFQPATSLVVRNKNPDSKQMALPPSPAPQDAKPIDSDDEFQVQSTPPHLKSGHDNKDILPPKRESPLLERTSQPVVQTKPVSRLGAIGGAKRAVSPACPALQSSNKTSTTLGADEDTASETASDADVTASLPDESMESPPPPPPEPTRKKVGGLGRIGGGSKSRELETVPLAADAVSSSPPPPVRRLGAIGGSTAVVSERDSEPRGRSAQSRTEQDMESAETTTTARETSQERADKKREQLKRDLEKQAAAGPSKKKRRF